jgi:uncharacterized protein with FMN-binding domain
MKYIPGLTLLLTAAGFALVSVLFSACAGFGRGAVADESAVEAAEIYEGLGRGFRGTIRVRVRMEAGTIAEIEIIESSEDAAVGGAAMEELTELVLLYSSAGLDAISGATESSKGFLEAVENAILSP